MLHIYRWEGHRYNTSEQGHDKVVEILIATIGTNMNVATEVSSVMTIKIKQLVNATITLKR